MLLTPDINAPKSVEDLLGPELLARLDRLSILSRKLFAGKLPGERRSKRRGQSVEFDDYRPYTRGDDLRHLDWNVLARFDRGKRVGSRAVTRGHLGGQFFVGAHLTSPG